MNRLIRTVVLAATTATALVATAFAATLPPPVLSAPVPFVASGVVQSGPGAAYLPDGTLAIVYAREATSDVAVVARDRAATGAETERVLWTAPAGSPAASVGSPAIATDATGNMLAVWRWKRINAANPSGPPAAIGLVSSYRPAGGTWGAAQPLPGTGDVEYRSDPVTLTADKPGSFIAGYLHTATDLPALSRFTAPGAWSNPINLATAGSDEQPVIAGRGDGVGIVAWLETAGTGQRLMARPTGVAGAVPVEVASDPTYLLTPGLGFDETGAATIVESTAAQGAFARRWTAATGFGPVTPLGAGRLLGTVVGRHVVLSSQSSVERRLSVRSLRPDGTWTASAPIGQTPGGYGDLRVAPRADGGYVGIFSTVLVGPAPSYTKTGTQMLGFQLAADGTPAVAGSPASTTDVLDDPSALAVSPAGDVTALGWRNGAAPAGKQRVWIMEADGADPVIDGITVPGTITQGQAGDFSATGTDTRTGVSQIRWTFGDGATATSAPAQAITHAFAGAGTYVVTARAVDGAGHVGDAASRTVTVTAPVTPPVSGPVTTPPPAAPRVPATLRGRTVVLDLDVALRRGATACPTGRTITTTVRPPHARPLAIARRSVSVTKITVNGVARCRATGTVTLRRAPAPGTRASLRLIVGGTTTVTRTVRITPPRVAAVLRGRTVAIDLDLTPRPGTSACPSGQTIAATIAPAGGRPLAIARSSVRAVRLRVGDAVRCRVSGALTLRSDPGPRLRTTLRVGLRSATTVTRTVRVSLPAR